MGECFCTAKKKTHVRRTAKKTHAHAGHKMTAPSDLPPVVYGGGALHTAAVTAAVAAAPHPGLAALPANHIAVLGQSPAVFKPPTPARYALSTGADGGATLTM